MKVDANTDTNQSSKTINLPDGSVEPSRNNNGQNPDEPKTPDEHVPPIEVPGRQDVPEHVPEKGSAKDNIFPFRPQ